MPGMPRMPGVGDVLKNMQTQTEVLAELPSTIRDLQLAVRGLSEMLAALKDTLASAQRVSTRIDEILDDIEEPVRALRPGIIRLAAALDSPVIDRIPATLEAIEAAVLPVTASAERARARWERARQGVRRLGRGGHRTA
jgi:chromosome segregation ATPase